MRCFIVDIDGTIANIDHRLHLIKGEVPRWDDFFDACVDDVPVAHIVELVQALSRQACVVYVSGRSDRVRDATTRWLARHQLPPGTLYMRRQGDHKPDHKLKLELLENLLADGFIPIMAFDDRDAVVKMWRDTGVPCAQVAPGDF